MNSKKYYVRENKLGVLTIFGNIPQKRIVLSIDKKLVIDDEKPFIEFPVKGFIYNSGDYTLQASDDYVTYNVFIKKSGDISTRILNNKINCFLTYNSRVGSIVGQGFLVTLPKDVPLEYETCFKDSIRQYRITSDGTFSRVQ